MRRPLSALLFTTALVLVAIPAAAQPLGTFSWQLQPYCNVITATVTQVGGTYRIEGTDSQCGATPASAVGMAFPNGDGTVSFGITIVTGPAAAPVHVRATIDLASLSGPWTDSAGNSGTFAFNQNTAGSARPAPAAPAQFGTVLVQPTDGVDRGLSARVSTDTGGVLGDSAAVFGQFGDASGWYSPGSAGVRGDSAGDSGVVGTTASGEGVVGIAVSGIGVYGSASAGGRGVYARTNDGGTALEINNGAIRVSGAVTPAFVHVTAAGNISYNTTRIDHPLTDGDPNAILIVTHDYGSGPYQTVPVGVWYDAGKWKIYNEDALANMTAGRRFNVLVIKR